MKPTLTLLAVLLLTCHAYSQTDTVIRYLTGNLEEARKREDVSYEVITITSKTPDGHYMVQDFLAETGKKIRQQYLDGKDSLTQIGPYLVYHENGETRTRGSYVDGRKTGIWRSWHLNKTIRDSCFYNDKGNISGTSMGWWEDGRVSDSAFYHPDSNGVAFERQFFPDGKLAGEGPVLNRAPNGKWTFYHSSGRPSATEWYENGEWKKMECYPEDGSAYSGACEPEIDAGFPGGIGKWQNYIVNSISGRAQQFYNEQATGTAVVQFVIDVKGKIRDVKIHESSGTSLDSHALDIIRQSPAWIPARQHNRPVKAYRRQPITFKLEER
jgi:TonB family protein